MASACTPLQLCGIPSTERLKRLVVKIRPQCQGACELYSSRHARLKAKINVYRGTLRYGCGGEGRLENGRAHVSSAIELVMTPTTVNHSHNIQYYSSIQAGRF